MENPKYLLSLVGKHRRILFLSLIISGIMSILGILIPYFAKAQIDQLQFKYTNIWFFSTSSLLVFFIWLGLPFLIELLRNIFLKRLEQKISLKLTFASTRHIRELVWEKFRFMDGSFFENNASRRIIGMVIRSDNIIKDSLYVASRILNSVVLIIVAIPVLGAIGWQLVAITFFSVFISSIISVFDQKREALYQAIRDRSFDAYSQIDSLLTYNYRDARALGAVNSLENKYDKVTYKQYLVEKEGQSQRHFYQSSDNFIRELLALAVNLVAGYWVISKGYSLGTFTLVVAYTMQLSRSFRDLTDLVRTSMEMDLRITQLKFFLNLRPRLVFSNKTEEIIEPPKQVSIVDGYFGYTGYGREEKAYLEMILERSRRFITRYGHNGLGWQLKGLIEEMEKLEKPTQVLKGIDFHLNRGEIVALLGRNGVGKTTITNVLMHIYELDRGKILIDNRPINDFEHQSLLQQFAVIQQFPIILWGISIRENLNVGINKEVSDDEIWKQLKIVGLSDKIKELPKGLDTIMGDEINLSGGQNQLLVIARVFLQQRPFIIFDEGMSNLDAEHEMNIVKLLKTQAKHSGVLFITHRITAARHADRIVVIDQGKISQEGTHTSLVKKDGIYKHFWNLQVVS